MVREIPEIYVTDEEIEMELISLINSSFLIHGGISTCHGQWST